MLLTLSATEALSGVSGSISLACWLFVLVRLERETENMQSLMFVLGTSAGRELQNGER